MTTTYTLSNSFHNTIATVRPIAITEGRFAGMHKIIRNILATSTRLKTRLTAMMPMRFVKHCSNSPTN